MKASKASSNEPNAIEPRWYRKALAIDVVMGLCGLLPDVSLL